MIGAGGTRVARRACPPSRRDGARGERMTKVKKKTTASAMTDATTKQGMEGRRSGKTACGTWSAQSSPALHSAKRNDEGK